MHIIILMCYEQCKMLRAYNHAGLFQAATCFDIHVASILTPRLVFKEQFVGGDAPLLSGLNYADFAKPLSSVGTLQSLPEGKPHIMLHT